MFNMTYCTKSFYIIHHETYTSITPEVGQESSTTPSFPNGVYTIVPFVNDSQAKTMRSFSSQIYPETST